MSERIPFYWAFLLVLILVPLALEPATTLVGVIWCYALSGLLMWVLGRLRRRPPVGAASPAPPTE